LSPNNCIIHDAVVRIKQRLCALVNFEHTTRPLPLTMSTLQAAVDRDVEVARQAQHRNQHDPNIGHQRWACTSDQRLDLKLDKESSVNIGNARYFHDRQRHDLALRMIRHEARTHTISRCTGLSDDRIRRLFRAYLDSETESQGGVRRRRGKSPRQIAFFTRNAQLQYESSFLANLFTTFGLMRERRVPLPGQAALDFGAIFCDAYETHRQLLQPASITFEHAWFLLQLLLRGEQLRISHCRQCRTDYVHDLINLTHRICPTCWHCRAAAPRNVKVSEVVRTDAA
jgi:hypothetical protein